MICNPGWRVRTPVIEDRSTFWKRGCRVWGAGEAGGAREAEGAGGAGGAGEDEGVNE
ncbi:MAG: hypothetical protein RID53_16795 [Coleofasciculus sp. B1-GNL1-01]|uniref:hypothetical protein n=1 Tax=Coleofasciculus sp. B1-GNL1-01 TaxID=3068484 RepID=UPI0032F19613